MYLLSIRCLEFYYLIRCLRC